MRRLPFISGPLLGLILMSACSKESSHTKWATIKSLKKNEELIILGANFNSTNKNNLKKQGIDIEGQDVAIIRAERDLDELEIPVQNNYRILKNEALEIEFPKSSENESIPRYLARSEFGLDRIQNLKPEYDGRGVIVGVLDDGLSLHQSGLSLTSEGKRKILKKTAASSGLKLSLEKELPQDLDVAEVPAGEKKFASIDEKSFLSKVDFNFNGKSDVIDVVVSLGVDGNWACVDVDADKKLLKKECSRNFSQTGDYLFWDKNNRYSFITELDKENSIVTISEPETGADSHGEGVASVMAGHQIGGRFNGMAPGAQILDYDLSSVAKTFEDNTYTIGTFVKAFDWLASNGANVVNISYSLFFHSVEGQQAMGEVLNYFVKEKNLVFSFSAGNNGPGLSSMNRRQIYPESALVVAAHTSKKLDQMVHGVSGLPEEGRVIFYSSRGPDASFGEGANVLGVLSNLVRSTPESGFAGFSGTSSASPSVGGVAAVLISALKQNNLPIDAATVVEALRLSGKPLKEAAFIEQGYGHPQVDKAFQIYQELISGKQFMKLAVTLGGERGLDSIPARGLFIKLTEETGEKEVRATIKGIASSLVTLNVRDEILKELVFEYSHPFITGPETLWTSVGASKFNIRIVPPKELSFHQEIFVEIRIKDKDTGLVLHTIPVTIIRPSTLPRTQVANGQIETQAGKRWHFNLDANKVKAFLVKLYPLSGNPGSLSIDHFNPSGVRTSIPSQLSEEDGLFLPVKESGYHQLTLTNYHGSERPADFSLAISPLRLTLNSSDIYSDAKTLSFNASEPLFGAELVLKNKATLIDSSVHQIGVVEAIKRKIQVSEKGFYQVKLRAKNRTEMSYPYSDCELKLGNKTLSEGGEIELAENGEKELSILCYPFESGLREGPKVTFILDILYRKPGEVRTKLNVAVGKNSWALSDEEFSTIGGGLKEFFIQSPQVHNGILVGDVNLWSN